MYSLNMETSHMYVHLKKKQFLCAKEQYFKIDKWIKSVIPKSQKSTCGELHLKC